MNIAFDAKRLFYNSTGLGNYSRSLVREIRNLNDENKLFLFSPTIKNVEFDDFLSGDYELITSNGKRLWRYKTMVNDLKRIQPDIYHGLSNELPVGIEKLANTKSVVTIHDLIFLRFPQYYPLVDRIFYREKFKRSCQKADHIIAVSEATKKDIIEFFKISEQKISVIYQSCSPVFYTNMNEEKIEEERPYFLFVSSITERKNLKLIISALAGISESSRPKLVVVGEGGKYKREVLNQIALLNLDEDVDFMGYVDNLKLKALYAKAICTIYPSFYEGFGIPIVESLLCGTPIIASNISAMPEAASGLGILINPLEKKELIAAMQHYILFPKRISEDDVVKIRSKFDPKKLANRVLTIYRQSDKY